MKKKILIINTGGTFNKKYSPTEGELYVDQGTDAFDEIASKWLCSFELLNIINKDSLQITTHDRLELLTTLINSRYDAFIVIHGTDTLNLTAEYIADAEIPKTIVFTGAMVPYSVDPVEATANFASAVGYLQNLNEEGVFITLNGVFGKYDKIKKDKQKGRFILV